MVTLALFTINLHFFVFSSIPYAPGLSTSFWVRFRSFIVTARHRVSIVCEMQGADMFITEIKMLKSCRVSCRITSKNMMNIVEDSRHLSNSDSRLEEIYYIFYFIVRFSIVSYIFSFFQVNLVLKVLSATSVFVAGKPIDIAWVHLYIVGSPKDPSSASNTPGQKTKFTQINFNMNTTTTFQWP